MKRVSKDGWMGAGREGGRGGGSKGGSDRGKGGEGTGERER